MATIDVINPATAETIDSVPNMTAEEVDEVVETAKQALPEWLDATPGDRAALLLQLANVIEENAEELAQIESRNVGKPLMVSRDEMPFCADNLRFFAGAARNLEGKSAGEYIKGYTSMIRREPIGIVAGICPWNYPLMMAIWKLGPAIAAGNVQILKPSEQTPMSLLRFVELAKDVIPKGVLQVVTGDGVPTGERLVGHPDIGLVSLTGDIATGKLIARNAADTLKRVHLELGGKAPMVVFDDADPAQVAEGIKIAGFWNSGQDCTAGSRIIAGPKIYDALLEALVPTVEGIKVGDPASSDDIEMGPVITKDQQDRILGFLERAKGATVLTGGSSGRRHRLVRAADHHHRRRPGRRDRPERSVRAGDHGAALRRRQPGDRVGERCALRPRRLGLDARRRSRAERGTQAAVRNGLGERPPRPLSSELPHGGYKQSGYGKDMSIYSMEEYTQLKHVAMKID